MKRFAIIPLLLLGLLSGGFRGLGNTTPCTFTVPNAGAVTANTLAGCLSNPADTVMSLSNWSTAANYLMAGNRNQYIFKSTATYRDAEVSLWARQGYTYLRLDGNGTAIYFYHDGETTNGQLDIGIVTGLTETAYPSGTYYPLYSNTDLVHTIGTAGTVCTCGYTKTATQGQYWTFGVSGFDIYVKYNGTQFASFKEYRQMNYGSVAVKSNATGQYGFRNADGNAGHITITPTYPPALYSRYSIGELDMRDFDLRAASTTGSITSGSNNLALAAKQNFKIGDWVIVEIGAEAGAGARGTIGVGGSWPSQSYANLAAFPGSAADLTFAWARDTGQVYRYQVGTGTWVTRQTVAAPTGQVQWQPTASYYYPNLAVPRSLHAKISAISADGLTLTLLNLDGSAANASATATNANVYLDNLLPFNNLVQASRGSASAITPANTTLVIPSGTYILGGFIYGSSRTGWTIKGAGKASTTLASAKGLQPAGIQLQAFPNLMIRDLTLNGNYGNNYFGLNFYDTLSPIPTSNQVSEYDAAGNIVWVQTLGSVSDTSFAAAWFPSGINLQQADNSTVQDVNVNEVFTNAVAFQDTANAWAYRVTVQHTDPQQIYTQWQLEWANTTGGGSQDCVINSTYMMQGQEAFGSTGTQFIRSTLNNAAFSLNSSGDFLVQDGVVNVSLNSGAPAWSINNAVVQIDTNTGPGYAAQGGNVNNIQITANYLNATKDMPVGITIGGTPLQNVNVTGGSYTGPNYNALSSQPSGPQGIASSSSVVNTTVNGFTSRGTIHPAPYTFTNSNIGVGNGSVINSCADVFITAPTTSGNTIPCP